MTRVLPRFERIDPQVDPWPDLYLLVESFCNTLQPGDVFTITECIGSAESGTPVGDGEPRKLPVGDARRLGVLLYCAAHRRGWRLAKYRRSHGPTIYRVLLDHEADGHARPRRRRVKGGGEGGTGDDV